ncbi:extensin family protein [Vibrio astriarenae]
MNKCTHLNQIPIHYARYSEPNHYGTRGKPYSIRGTPELIDSLCRCFSEISSSSKPLFGDIQTVTTAGAFVNKKGQHGKGRAFDLDAIFWSEQSLIANEYNEKTRLYLGVESLLRRHFGTVLGYNYDSAHRDHFHVDLGTPIGFSKKSKSKVLYVQASLTHLHTVPVSIDGVWGTETREGVKTAITLMNIDGDLEDKLFWMQYLYRSAQMFFNDKDKAICL